MLCLMHEGQPYGHLTVQGRPITADSLARLVGESAAAVKRWMKELADNDVYSVSDDGLIFSRRMVRDEDLRERRAAGGQAGGEHGKKGGSHGAKGGRPKKEKTPDDASERGVEKPPLKPPPSSSTSTSSSSSIPPNPPQQYRSPPLSPEVEKLMEAGGFVSPPSLDLVAKWKAAGADFERDILPVIRAEARNLRERTGQAPRTLSVFDKAMMGKLAEDASEVQRLAKIERRLRRMDEQQLSEERHH